MPLPQPVIASVTPLSSSALRVAFSTHSEYEDYEIERGGVTVASGVTASPWDDSGLTANTQYSYRVRGRVGEGAPEPTYIALDDFDDRTVSGSWGTAQTGGTYTSSSDSGVTGGRGWLNGQSMRTSHLQSVQVLNAESMVRIDFPVLQTLGSVRAGLMFRTQGTTTGTAAHALIARVERVVTTGDMSIELRFQDGVTSGTFGVTPLGSFPTSAFSLWMRAQCYTDGGAVRVRARVWIDGDAEPTGTWHLNTTTTNLLASAGGVGCHHHGSSTYNGGQTFFDNFSSVEL
jgi:hypothetical protein